MDEEDNRLFVNIFGAARGVITSFGSLLQLGNSRGYDLIHEGFRDSVPEDRQHSHFVLVPEPFGLVETYDI
jgi:hypothetical protein